MGPASYFLAVTTFGAADDAAETVAHIRSVHERVRGRVVDGRPYAATDPHLLRWVHVAEVHSFLTAHQHYGAAPLDAAGRDGHVRDTARVAREVGVLDPPESEAELAAQLEAFRPELAGTPEARATARFLLLHPPLPLAARAAYALLAAAAVGLLPRWTRRPLRLPDLPALDRTVVALAGHGVTAGIRWAMSPPTPTPSPRPDPSTVPLPR